MHPKGTEALFLMLGKAQNLVLVKQLLSAKVEFVVIGGTALAFHDLRDITDVDDLDLMVAPTSDNLARIVLALQTANAPLLDPPNPAKLNFHVPVKDAGPQRKYWADLLTPQDGIEFSTVSNDASTSSKDGLLLRIASINHLRQMKLLAIRQAQLDGLDPSKHEADFARLQDIY